MQRRVIVNGRPYWITTHDLGGDWYAFGKFEAETITVAAGYEPDAIRLWQEAAQSAAGRGESSAPSEVE